MIFITLGSQKFQFNRLLIELDRLVETKVIEEEIFAQIGYSDYRPKNFEYKEFLDREEFLKAISSCDKVITHGGTGAIVGAIKQSKKVIAIPRLSIYKEHVDNHQLQIVTQFDEMKLIKGVIEISNLKDAYISLEDIKFKEYRSDTQKVIESIESFIIDLNK
ncbi:PssE/Cps14G family polysaccharide biosynthesis glycosyltransferase [Turicibacter sanguinis]|uniref:PssE/Cps14G family polysaccharide biosynthesis glycosyltransferase n=1 Tax=Turicibacter sanguinis TaxID=154288 RepID=UPI0018A905D0|nr:PssE/Cps14G family polysaccharide biosynthesis glycosyltransferase [Turicibacter sanguinis]MDB8551632.1 glycosyltransferase [Turicibacter sanguinis]